MVTGDDFTASPAIVAEGIHYPVLDYDLVTGSGSVVCDLCKLTVQPLRTLTNTSPLTTSGQKEMQEETKGYCKRESPNGMSILLIPVCVIGLLY